MKRIPAVIAALYRGRQLADVETWKVAGTATAAVSGLLSALVGIAAASGWLDEIDPQTIMEVSSALVTLVSAVLAYIQVATTEKIGLDDPDEPDDSGDSGVRREPLQAGRKAGHKDPRGLFGE